MSHHLPDGRRSGRLAHFTCLRADWLADRQEPYQLLAQHLLLPGDPAALIE